MADTDTRNYVLAVENDKVEATRIAKATAEKLEAKSTTLILIVQSLGEFINDSSPAIRARAISYLVAIISSLPPKFLSRQQIQVLTEFLCDRIEDGGSIDGLARLAELDRFNDEMTQSVLRRVCEVFSGELQQKPQKERWPIYSLVNTLMDKRRKAIRAMGIDSLNGIVSLVAGEKDPRNLMLIFSMLKVLMVEWDIVDYELKLFDSVYVYFPITFRPPPNDPYGITAQDLKDRLKACLASNGRLAPHAFPNLLDRLDSTSTTVKKDVLQALAACALEYDPATISQYSVTLWDAIKYEVLQAQEPFLADEALVILHNIGVCLSRSNNQNHGPTASPLVQYLKPVNKECLDHLSEPASRQAKASGDILKAVASASIQSFEVMIKSVGPALLTLYQAADGIISQRAVLEVTNKIFEAAVDVYGSWTENSSKNPEGRENILQEFKDKLLAIYSQALMATVKEEVSFRLITVEGLLLLSQMRSLLQDDEVGLFVQHFDDIILNEDSYGRDELKKTVVTALTEISKSKPQLITDITFPAFLARLPDNEEEAVRSRDYYSVLEGLAEISVGKELLDTIMRRLLNKLDILVQASNRTGYPYTCAVLSTVHHVLKRSVDDHTISLDSYFDRIVVGMSQRAVQSASGPLSNETVLDLLGRIMNLTTRNSTPLRIGMVAENVYKLFRSSSSQVDEKVVLLEPPDSVILSTWLLAALPRDMNLGVLDTSQIPFNLQHLRDFASTCSDPAIQSGCLRQIALYTNKHLPQPDLPLISDSLDASFKELASHSKSQSVLFNLRLIFTHSKALALRLAPVTSHILSGLVSLLDSSQYDLEVSRLAAAGFGTILAVDDVLSKTNYALIRLLAPQKIFQTLVPLISDKFKQAKSPAEKENYLVALSGILGTVSSDIVMPELPTLLPLLLQSLEIFNPSVQIATLETFAVVITSNPSALEESGHIPALVKRLLRATTMNRSAPKPGEHAKVRRLAATCITLLPKHITGATTAGKKKGAVSPLLPLKREVLQGLALVLDDPRRDVRKEAVDARAQWIRGVDDEDESDDDD